MSTLKSMFLAKRHLDLDWTTHIFRIVLLAILQVVNN